jgi:hypothetical protein
MFERKLNPALYDKVLGMYAAAGVAPRIVHTKTSPYEQAGLMLIATGVTVATATTEGAGAAVFPVVLVALTAVVAYGRRGGASSAAITVGPTRAS